MSSRLARRPREVRATAEGDPAAANPASPRRPQPAIAAPDRSRDVVHARRGPLRGAVLAGTQVRCTHAADCLRVRQAGTIVGRPSKDASCAKRPRPSPTSRPSRSIAAWVISREQPRVISRERRSPLRRQSDAGPAPRPIAMAQRHGPPVRGPYDPGRDDGRPPDQRQLLLPVGKSN